MDQETEEDKRRPADTAGHDQNEFAGYPWVVRYSLQIGLDLLKGSFQLIRPYSPQLIPLAVFILTIPALLFFSLSSGWFVWRSIAVGWEVPLYLQYGDGGSPYASARLPALASHQLYDVSLHLTVPVCESNLALGNFMATLVFTTPNNRTLSDSRKSALVIPSSLPYLSFLWNSPGMTEITIPLLSNTEFSATNVVAHVEVGRKDHWRTLGNGEGRELSVSSALLRGVVVHKGIKGLFTRFPLLTSLTAAGTFFFISFVILASCVLPAIEWQVQDDTRPTEQAPQEQPRRQRKQGRDDSKPARRRTIVPKRSRSLGSPSRMLSQQEIKMEEIPSVIPTTPLRRRRSRLSQASDPES